MCVDYEFTYKEGIFCSRCTKILHNLLFLYQRIIENAYTVRISVTQLTIKRKIIGLKLFNIIYKLFF